MKILAEISEATLGIGDLEKLNSNYELRKNPRAILRDKNGNIALQNIQRDNFHKLPGGGMEEGESLEDAVQREIKEEVGCDCTVSTLLGMTIEYRNKYNLLQVSYAFVADVVGEIGEPQLDSFEIAEGLTNIWMSPTEALEKMKADIPETYEANFILKREISFLDEYLKKV
jgi:8-oxo-dGTP diphosphatase